MTMTYETTVTISQADADAASAWLATTGLATGAEDGALLYSLTAPVQCTYNAAAGTYTPGDGNPASPCYVVDFRLYNALNGPYLNLTLRETTTTVCDAPAMRPPIGDDASGAGGALVNDYAWCVGNDTVLLHVTASG
jgi:hypothetical protein